LLGCHRGALDADTVAPAEQRPDAILQALHAPVDQPIGKRWTDVVYGPRLVDAVQS
jgi:hypothetical protein